MEIGMLNFWLELLVTAQTKENYFSDKNQRFLVPIFNFFTTLVNEAWAITLVYVVDILKNKKSFVH